MGLSLHFKSVLARVFEGTGITRWYMSSRSHRGCPILMYHRIVSYPGRGSAIQAGMHVAPSTFEMHIGYLKGFFTIVPLSEIVGMRNGSLRDSREKPVCVLTFDDGWSDFFFHAFPILRANDVPATVFLPTNVIGTEQRFWTDVLADILGEERHGSRRNPSADTSGNSLAERIMSLRGAPDSILEEAIALLKNRREQEIHEALEELRKTRKDEHEEKPRAFLTWGEIRQMRKSGLITFGSHTANHRILVHLEDGEVVEELGESKMALIREGAADPSFIPFSYPNGNHDERIVGMVKEAGYHLAVTTEPGWNGPVTPLFRLQRIAIHQDMASTREMFGCRIAELL